MVCEMKAMKICVNGTQREVPNGTTVEQLIELFQLKKKSVVMELNRQVVDRNRYSATALQDSDTVEIVHFVGGG